MSKTGDRQQRDDRPLCDAAAADPLERVSSRPDLLILGYPRLEGTAINEKGESQYCTFTRTTCRPQDYERYMPIRAVTADMPPTFIYHTTSDELVPVEGVSVSTKH